MAKIISSKEAAQKIKDNDVVGINGFAFGFGFPETLAKALGTRYQTEQHPQNLTLLFASGCGDGGIGDFGLDHFAQEGMVHKIIAGHVGLAKKLSGMIRENKICAYNFPQGVIVHMFREMAGGKKGILTHVGLDTFADPRVEGGKMNALASEDLVEVVNVGGEEHLYYQAPSLQAALIRGTTADEAGNLTVEKEGVLLETMHLAAAAKNAGGIVIAQVEHIAQKGTLDPRKVTVPGILVDYIVQAPKEDHQMHVKNPYNPSFTGEVKIPVSQVAAMPLHAKKVIARRCAMELKKGTAVNLGIGVPEGVALAALEEGIADWMTMTIEAGAVGGIPASGYGLGASANVEALIGQPNLFDIYDGGGLDIAGQYQRQQISGTHGRLRRICKYFPEYKKSYFLRHFYRRSQQHYHRSRRYPYYRRRPAYQVFKTGRANYIQRQLCSKTPAGSALCNRTRRFQTGA